MERKWYTLGLGGALESPPNPIPCSGWSWTPPRNSLPQGSSRELSRPGLSLPALPFNACASAVAVHPTRLSRERRPWNSDEPQDGQRRAARSSSRGRCCQSSERHTARPIALVFPQHLRKSCLLTFEQGEVDLGVVGKVNARDWCSGASGCQSSLWEASFPSLQVQM